MDSTNPSEGRVFDLNPSSNTVQCQGFLIAYRNTERTPLPIVKRQRRRHMWIANIGKAVWCHRYARLGSSVVSATSTRDWSAELRPRVHRGEEPGEKSEVFERDFRLCMYLSTLYVSQCHNGLPFGVNMDPAHAAFGFGRRICPGRYMAFSALCIAIASIIATFDITKAVDENGVIIEPSYEYQTGLVCAMNANVPLVINIWTLAFDSVTKGEAGEARTDERSSILRL
ncbi:hypothetical protein FPV67DRAFT_1449579 [Lyophyllum atratum]|nr:hypothetical protein FPV67DRAFT_1449579 [Lyophyllum atratum]